MPVTAETAQQIAFAYREVWAGEKLLVEIKEALSKRQVPDIRNAFGRYQSGLQLGVPNGDNGHRLFNVEWSLAAPIIEAHVAKQRAIIAALSETAKAEIEGNRA